MFVRPESMEHQLLEEGRQFKGSEGTFTTTDAVVDRGLVHPGNRNNVKPLPADMQKKVIDDIHRKLEEVIDDIKVKGDCCRINVVN